MRHLRGYAAICLALFIGVGCVGCDELTVVHSSSPVYIDPCLGGCGDDGYYDDVYYDDVYYDDDYDVVIDVEF